MALKYPKFIGKNSAKMKLFRMQKQHPIGDKKRYPIGVRLPIQVDISFGVNTPTRKGALRINTNEAIKASANKLKTKELLSAVGVPVLPSWPLSKYLNSGILDIDLIREDQILETPKVLKHKRLSGGREMAKIENLGDLLEVLSHIGHLIREIPENNKQGRQQVINNYFFEPFFEIAAEYRIHGSPWLYNSPMKYTFHRNVRKDDSLWSTETVEVLANHGEICCARKMLTQAAKDGGEWSRNIKEGVAFMKYFFTKPPNWADIVEDSILALSAVGLDFGCVDILVGANGNYVISETGANPGMYVYEDSRPNLSITAQAYQQAFARLIMEKAYRTGAYVPEVRSALNNPNNI